MVALYSRNLLPQEVRRHYHLGPEAETEAAAPKEAKDPNKELFAQAIEPIFAKHCLECHDPATRKGKLDMSTALAMSKGGAEGAAIVPGDAEASLLWDRVVSDEMPEDRDPLSPTEKALLKEWIEGGA